MSNKKKDNFGVRAIIKNYSVKSLLKGGKYPLLISIIVMLICLFSKGIDIQLIEGASDLIISIIPSLLGFVLSGYAILIGFGNITIIAKKQKDDKPTLYQKISAVFAVGLIMQVLLLGFTFFVKLVIKQDIVNPIGGVFIYYATNYFTFFSLVFGLFYVTYMIKDLVVNVFNIGQIQNIEVNKFADKSDKIEEGKNQQEKKTKNCP